MSRSRGFCFTVNNYTEENVAALKKFVDNGKCRYIIFGKEVGEKRGTPHLQGYIHFKHGKTLTAAQKTIKAESIKCAMFVARGSVEQNNTYCSKSGDVFTAGEKPEQGKRTDLDELFAMIADGADDVAIQEKFKSQYIRYHKAIDRIRQNYRQRDARTLLREKMKNFKPRDWQAEAMDRLTKQNDRQVTWVVDSRGNQGKTMLAKQLIAQKNAFYIQGGKTADIAHAFNYEEIVIFDFTRSQEEMINYSIIEKFKNGVLFSPKYNSTTKLFTPCKVLCLSNFHPEQSKLSDDRWDIMNLDSRRECKS